jgi:hypothetical protein
MHIRRAILENVRAQLKVIPNYGGVWIQRFAPNRNAFPAITLFAENETVDTLTIHNLPRAQERTLTLIVNCWIKGTPDGEKIESDFDNAALDIESTLILPTQAIDFYLLSTDFQFVEDDAEINAVTLTYKIVYETTEFNPLI